MKTIFLWLLAAISVSGCAQTGCDYSGIEHFADRIVVPAAIGFIVGTLYVLIVSSNPRR